MMKILFVIYLSFVSTQLASANSELKQLFSASFNTQYEEAKCGDNILGLVERADKKKINLNNAHILEMTNAGFSVFGLLNAEFARASGRHGAPGERNWFHHLVLEMDGLIYDFDFGTAPKVTTKAYFEQMFSNDKRKSEGGEFYVSREEKLKYYQIVVSPALTTLSAHRDRVPSPTGETMRLHKFLESYADR